MCCAEVLFDDFFWLWPAEHNNKWEKMFCIRGKHTVRTEEKQWKRISNPCSLPYGFRRCCGQEFWLSCYLLTTQGRWNTCLISSESWWWQKRGRRRMPQSQQHLSSLQELVCTFKTKAKHVSYERLISRKAAVFRAYAQPHLNFARPHNNNENCFFLSSETSFTTTATGQTSGEWVAKKKNSVG